MPRQQEKKTHLAHTPGAIRAAEIITGAKYDLSRDSAKLITTTFGKKSTMGVADIIDRETAARDLLETLKAVEADCMDRGDCLLWTSLGTKIRDAIAKAERLEESARGR